MGRYLHSTKRFIANLCTINDGGEFRRSICDIYLKDLEPKVKHQGDHVTFLYLEITIKDGIIPNSQCKTSK